MIPGDARMKAFPHIKNRYLFFLDLLLLPLAAYVAFVLRLETFELTRFQPAFFLFTVTGMVVIPLIFRAMGLYSRYWRYASVEELILLVGAVTLGALLTGAITGLLIFLVFRGILFPRTVSAIFIATALLATAGPRFLLRLMGGPLHSHSLSESPRGVLIVGAGDAGQMIARDIKQNPGMGLQVIGFVDDDARKQNLNVGGVPIFGGREQIPELVEEFNIDEIIIAMPSISGEVIRDILNICDDTGVQTRILPSLSEILTRDVGVRNLRQININDLLRREPIKTDLDSVYQLVRGKTVLVTGAGGSIGSEICRQIAKGDPARLILLGHGENSIFQIYHELKQAFTDGQIPLSEVYPVIADVRDWVRLEHIFQEIKPQIVFHTAAHKHVPLMEANPADAITNNILGSHFLLEACMAHDVDRFVLISTDKAVNPVNVMGVTKRMAELLVLQAASRSGRPYVAVRFGNVLGSRGSVVPFFQRQIEQGGPVTVTHPEVTRYFMTIPEAVQLVLQAAVLGEEGDLFMLDMGEPVKIVDLARDLIRLSGLTPEKDIEIVFTGLRPGEKLQEELYQSHEDYAPTTHDKILKVNGAHHYSQDLDQAVEVLYRLVMMNRIEEALSLIASLAPEYQPPQPVTPRTLSEFSLGDVQPKVPLYARWY